MPDNNTQTEIVTDNSGVTNGTVYHGLRDISQQLYNNRKKIEDQLYRIEKIIGIAGFSICICLTAIAVAVICGLIVLCKI